MPLSSTTRRRLLTVAVVLLVPLATLLLVDWSFKQVATRYLALGLAVLGFVLWPFIVVSKYNRLVDEAAGQQRPPAVRRMKLAAEICAGFALMTFLSVYFRWGEQIDRQNASGRSTLVSDAKSLLDPIMTPQYCSSIPYRELACKSLREDLALLDAAVIGRDEKSIDKGLTSVEFTLDSGGIDGLTHEQEQAVQNAASKLRGIDVDGGMLAFVFTALQLYAFILALMAVSSKTAVALFEYHDANARVITLASCRRGIAAWWAAQRALLGRLKNRRGAAPATAPAESLPRPENDGGTDEALDNAPAGTASSPAPLKPD